MDFAIPEPIRAQRAELRRFVDAELLPLEHDFLNQPPSETLPRLEALRERVRERGWWAPHFSEDYGGMGLSLTEFAHVSEELGRVPFGHYIFGCAAPDVGNMELLLAHGTEAQKETYLKPLAAGKVRSCFAMTEPEYPGSNPTWMGTTARADGDDYVIDGHKWFATAAEGSQFAIVMAITDPEAERHRCASQLVVPMNAPGVALVKNLSVMGGAGRGPFSHGELRFQNCRVPKSSLLGPEGAGFVLAQERLGPGRIHHCMRWIGIAERAFELMCAQAARREVAPGRPLGAQGMAQAWIAESRAEIDAARLLVLQTAWRIDREGAAAAREAISAIKLYVAVVLANVLDRAIQAHGGLGLTDETPLAFWYRHERAARIYDGADEVHKLSLAKRILRRFQADGELPS